MKARIILLAALLFVSFNVTFAQNDLDSRLREAVNCIDNGLTTQGIRLLESAVKDYPKDFVANSTPTATCSTAISYPTDGLTATNQKSKNVLTGCTITHLR